MKKEKKRVCLALLYYLDGRPVSFTYKNDFDRFVEKNHREIFSDEVLVILHGGSHKTVTLEAARDMAWMMDAA